MTAAFNISLFKCDCVWPEFFFFFWFGFYISVSWEMKLQCTYSMSPVIETSKQSQRLIKTKQINSHLGFFLHFCVNYIWWINYQTISGGKCKWVTPVLTFWRQKTEQPNLGGKGDKLLLCCLSPGPLFIIQCENFLDESQGCLCILRLVGMPVFHRQG